MTEMSGWSDLNSLLGTRSAVVDLGASLAAFVGPGEVGNGNDEEASRVYQSTGHGQDRRTGESIPVARVGDTGKGIVPGGEGSQNTKRTTGLDEPGVGRAAVVLQVTDTQHEEGKVERAEEEEESHSRAQSTDEQDEGEDEPALQEID